MSKKSNRINVPEARAAMDKFKMEAANEVGVNLKNGYNGDLSSREAGSIGGQMVKKKMESYEKNLKGLTRNGRGCPQWGQPRLLSHPLSVFQDRSSAILVPSSKGGPSHGQPATDRLRRFFL